MTSIMQKISEDVSSVVEYMANNTSEVKLQIENKVYTLSLKVEEIQE